MSTETKYNVAAPVAIIHRITAALARIDAAMNPETKENNT